MKKGDNGFIEVDPKANKPKPSINTKILISTAKCTDLQSSRNVAKASVNNASSYRFIQYVRFI